MKLVIIESPYAGDIEGNTTYARQCVRDSLERGEAPIASHLLYPQPGILREEVPEERAWGIAAGLAWREVAQLDTFYVDRGWSTGMRAALESCLTYGRKFEIRTLDKHTRDMVGADEKKMPMDVINMIAAALENPR